MSLIAWLVAVAAAALAVLLSFAGSMAAAPRFSLRQRLLIGALAGLGVAAAAATGYEHGFWSALGPLLFAGFALLVVLAPTTRRGSSLAAVTRTTAKRPDGSTWYVDDAHNRRLCEQEIERALASERAGAPPPAGAASWEAHWRQYEDGLRQWQQNGADYVAKLRVLRAQTAPPTQPAQSAQPSSSTPNARQ